MWRPCSVRFVLSPPPSHLHTGSPTLGLATTCLVLVFAGAVLGWVSGLPSCMPLCAQKGTPRTHLQSLLRLHPSCCPPTRVIFPYTPLSCIIDRRWGGVRATHTPPLHYLPPQKQDGLPQPGTLLGGDQRPSPPPFSSLVVILREAAEPCVQFPASFFVL